jgi:hypothetical protein
VRVCLNFLAFCHSARFALRRPQDDDSDMRLVEIVPVVCLWAICSILLVFQSRRRNDPSRVKIARLKAQVRDLKQRLSLAKEEEWANIKSLRADVAAADERATRKEKVASDAQGKVAELQGLVSTLQVELEVEEDRRLKAEQVVSETETAISERLGTFLAASVPCVCRGRSWDLLFAPTSLREDRSRSVHPNAEGCVGPSAGTNL